MKQPKNIGRFLFALLGNLAVSVLLLAAGSLVPALGGAVSLVVLLWNVGFWSWFFLRKM